jgi:hypothetical protein
MARIRSIKPEFWVSEQVAECSPSARLTFVGMWTFSDDNGVHPAKPKTLKAELYPMDDISAGQVAEWVAELIAVGLVAEFKGPEDGDLYWHITGWARHQKIDKPSAKYPTPPAPNSASGRRAVAEGSSNGSRAPSPGEDRRGRERKGEAASPKAPPTGPTGTRLPADWVMADDLRAYCRAERPELDPDAVAADFRDYWTAQPGKDGRKADWAATWKRWVRNQRVSRDAAGATTARRSALHADTVFEGGAP